MYLVALALTIYIYSNTIRTFFAEKMETVSSRSRYDREPQEIPFLLGVFLLGCFPLLGYFCGFLKQKHSLLQTR